MWVIYKHTFPNGKVYIGQTKQTTTLRWYNGKGYKLCPVMWKAICKYGWENVVSEIIEENIETIEQANEREKYWIKHYNSYVNAENSNGYNATLGGGGVNTVDYNEIFSLWEDGCTNGKIAEAMCINKDTVTKALKSFGVTDEELKERKRIALSKSNIVYDSNKIIKLWEEGKSMSFIQAELNCSDDTVRRALVTHGVSVAERKARGMEGTRNSPNAFNKKAIVQLTMDGKYIKTFNCIADALREINAPIRSGNISQVCKHKRNSYLGYKWMYASEYEAKDNVEEVV